MSFLPYLKRINLFQGMTDEQLAILEQSGHTVDFSEGDVVFSEHSTGQEMFFVLEGRVEILVNMNEESEEENAPIHTNRPGEVFGEFSFIDGGERSATAQVIEHALVFVLSRDGLEKAASVDPYIGYILMYNLSATLVQRIRMTTWELRASMMY